MHACHGMHQTTPKRPYTNQGIEDVKLEGHYPSLGEEELRNIIEAVRRAG